MKYSLNEIILNQSNIISIQSKAINGLCETLGQYLTQEELDGHPAVKMINTAASIERGIDNGNI